MNSNSESSFIRFNELIQALSTKSVIRTSNGSINISGTILSGKDFDKLYLSDVKDLLSKYEESISPEFAPTTQLYSTLDIFSSPVLKNTGVPEIVSKFYKKMQSALQDKDNKKTFETTISEYTQTVEEPPVFMLATMATTLLPKQETHIYEDLMPNSSTLLEGYGTKYSGSDILELSDTGFIEPEAPMSMLVYKSLYAQDKNSSDYIEPVSYTQLLDFYSPEKNPNRLRKLVKDGKITPEFLEHYNEMLNNVSNKQRNEFFSDLTTESKESACTSEDFSNEILNYANLGIIPDTVLENNISGDFLKKLYLAKAISISRVFQIYQTAPKYFSAVKSILTPEEITAAHSKDEISDDSLMYIPKDSRVAYLRKNNTKFSTMMYLFLHHDGFSITELKQLLTENKIHENLDAYIDLGSSPARIKELYENFLIDYQCIKNLKTAGILTDKDMHTYNFALNKEKIYQDFTNTSTLPIIGSANVVPFSTTGVFLGKTVEISSERLQNSYRILGAPEEQTDIPTIIHKDEHKKSSFLNNYNVVPLKHSNLIALVPPENTSYVYIMPYQEAAFILYNNRLPNNFSETECIKEIKPTEKLPEEILRVANQFEEAIPHLTRLGYSETMDYNECMNLMLEQYEKIKIKGEN